MSADAAPDGSPVGFFTRLSADEEPVVIHSAIAPGCSVLDLGCGGGRFAHPLIALGHPVVAVDQSPEMLAHVVGAEKVLADIEGLDLGRTFGAVLLAGSLVNFAADDDRRIELLRTCARHVAPGGKVILQRLAPDWVPAPFTTEADGVSIELASVEASGPEFSGTITYGIGADRWVQQARARVLDDQALESLLARVGLTLSRHLDWKGTWVEVVAAERDESVTAPDESVDAPAESVDAAAEENDDAPMSGGALTTDDATDDEEHR